jgi:hypothetical protein
VIVKLQEGRFLLDPGYLLHTPVALPVEGCETRHASSMNTIFLRSESANIFCLYTLESGQIKWRYRLRATRIPTAEFTQHWLRSFSLNTMENLMLSRLEDHGRIYFRKDRLAVVSETNRQKRIMKGSEFGELSQLFHLPADLILQAQAALLSRGSLKHS